MRLALAAAFAAFAADQALKLYVLTVLDLDRLFSRDVLPPYVNFRMGWNRGINFGLFDSESEALRWILIGVSILLAFAALYWCARRRRVERIFTGLLAGGALGNALDRLLHGAVVDFLNVTCCGVENPFVFNLADAAIVGGAFGLVAYCTLRPDKG
ncbi:MAG: signal peptidase II [Rhodobacteraceae bacterium]|nr:signal peptidase II [Paracoccaceae bacterium]